MITRIQKTHFTFIMSIILICSSIVSAFDEKSVVDGVAQFMLDRAQQNYLFVFENQMKENGLFKKYFPQTNILLKSMDLSTLLTNGKIIRESILKDMGTAGNTSMDFYWRGIITTFKDSLLQIKDSIKKYDSTFKEPQKLAVDQFLNSITNIKHISSATTDSLDKFQNSTRAILDTLWNHQTNCKKCNSVAVFLGDAEFYKVAFTTAVERFKIITDTSVSYTTRMSTALQILKMVLWTKNQELFRNQKEYFKFKRQFDGFTKVAFFFAQISDANSSDQVKEILKAVTVPAVSYGKKRKENQVTYSINSYLGICGGWENTSDKTWLRYYGLYAPVGIEGLYGLTNKSSIGIIASLFDFGAAINAQLYQNRTPRLADLFSPGFAILYGIPEIPISVGIQVSYSTGLNISSRARTHMSVFAAFDMPLFIIEPIN